MKRKSWKTACLTALVMLSLTSGAMAADHVEDVEAVSQVYGDGEKLSHVILTYDAPIAAASVDASDYTVEGRTVKTAYVSKTTEPGTAADAGNYVVVALEPTPMTDQMPDPHPEEKGQHKKKNGGGPTLGSHGNPQPLPVISAEVTQTGLVKTAEGMIYTPTETMDSTHTRQLVIEDFVQDTFKDSDGGTLSYNLYVPKNYDPSQSYPLVVFMHDAGAVSPEVKMTLTQGRGAIAWAEPSWQEDHPCFVLAPQYDAVVVNDLYQYGPELDRTIHLIESLSSQYAIDTNRIYNTGQSMGGMMSIQMDVSYPHFFAGSYLVASKWNEAITSPLGEQNIFAVASEGDPGAAPSLSLIMKQIEATGTPVNRTSIDTTLPQTEINAAAESILAPNVHEYLVMYKGGSHRSTWQHAYDMTPAMEWVFAQTTDHGYHADENEGRSNNVSD